MAEKKKEKTNRVESEEFCASNPATLYRNIHIFYFNV